MKKTIWTLVLFLCLQSFAWAQNTSESQSRSGETESLDIDYQETKEIIAEPKPQPAKAKYLRNVSLKEAIKTVTLPKTNLKEYGKRMAKYLKIKKESVEKPKKRSDAIDFFHTLGTISLALAFFFLVRLNLQTWWMFLIGLAYLVIGGLILIKLSDKHGKEGFGYLIIFLVFILIPGSIVMFMGLFSYLAVIWHAAVIFNIIGFSLLGVGLISLLLTHLL